jgi:hypothetical protein
LWNEALYLRRPIGADDWLIIESAEIADGKLNGEFERREHLCDENIPAEQAWYESDGTAGLQLTFVRLPKAERLGKGDTAKLGVLTLWRDRARVGSPCASCQSEAARNVYVPVRVAKMPKRTKLVRREQMRKMRERTPM